MRTPRIPRIRGIIYHHLLLNSSNRMNTPFSLFHTLDALVCENVALLAPKHKRVRITVYEADMYSRMAQL